MIMKPHGSPETSETTHPIMQGFIPEKNDSLATPLRELKILIWSSCYCSQYWKTMFHVLPRVNLEWNAVRRYSGLGLNAERFEISAPLDIVECARWEFVFVRWGLCSIRRNSVPECQHVTMLHINMNAPLCIRISDPYVLHCSQLLNTAVLFAV